MASICFAVTLGQMKFIHMIRICVRYQEPECRPDTVQGILRIQMGVFTCANELMSSVSFFDYNDGVLNYITTVKTLPDDFYEESTVAAICAKDNWLYVSNRGHNSISVFELCESVPRLKACVDCGGMSPRDFEIFGDLLVCTNENSDNVTFLMSVRIFLHG